MSTKEYPEDIQRLLRTVCDHFDQEDRATRERQIATYRKLKYLWDGISRIYYDSVAHDWRVYENRPEESDEAYYDKPVNVYRAYLESIIAALSITIPGIKCFPDDADNTLDLITAKAGDKIAELIYRHNDAPILWLHALFILCTEGMMACYHYPKEDESYGTYEEKQYENENVSAYVCPECGNQLSDEAFTNREKDEFDPDEDDVALHDVILNKDEVICPECAAQLDPDLQKSNLIVERLVGTTHKPKSRICTEIYGGLCVKIANYARKQEDTPYLQFSYETHFSNVLERYPELRKKVGGNTNFGSYDNYERLARLNTQYNGEMPINTPTVRNIWLRPSAFNVINNEDDVKKLKKEFPDGAYVVIVNTTFAEACNESLDDCWTLSINPLADFLTHDPLGTLLVSVQEITNDLISLVLQTIEHGIPQTFADPSVLNFEQYKQTSSVVGGIYPTKPGRVGKSIGEAFHEVKTATLSGEVLPFSQNIQEMGQIVSGALPSLFGGAIEGSRTASQYSMSRAQALQRLQNSWKLMTTFWKNIYGKCIPLFITEMKEDERSVELDSQGNFLNVFIRLAETQGKIGRIELEANENLPITWAQKKDVYMSLLELQNPQILQALAAPENLKNLSEAIGLNDFTIPGEDDRQKQLDEIKLLINSSPIEMPTMDPMTGQPTLQEVPSVEVDPDVDDHEIEADICRRYLVSEGGRLLKIENPLGYRNVLLHMKAHMQLIAPPMPADNTGQAPVASPKGNPYVGDVNVPA